MVPSLTPYDLPFPPKWWFHMPPTYANGHISATSDPIHFMFGSRVGFSGRRIERRYLRFEQIQDGGRRHLGKISNGHLYLRNRSYISATAHDLLIERASRGHLCDSTAFLLSFALARINDTFSADFCELSNCNLHLVYFRHKMSQRTVNVRQNNVRDVRSLSLPYRKIIAYVPYGIAPWFT